MDDHATADRMGFGLPPELTPEIEAELDRLAKRYRKAGGVGLQILGMIGGTAEGLVKRLPERVRDRLEGATLAALEVAHRAALASRRTVKDQPGWLNTAVTSGLGAAGGFGGLPGALAELPVTTTILLRTIQGVAAEHGFDPTEESVQFQCIQVLAAAGPLEHDDGLDLSFVASRATISGASVHALIAKVAPRLAEALGRKLATQMIPVLGAAAGAATNYAYTSYYQEVAHVSFGLRRLAIEKGIPEPMLLKELRDRMTTPVVRREL